MNFKTEAFLFDFKLSETGVRTIGLQYSLQFQQLSVKIVCTDINPESLPRLDLFGCALLFPYSGQHSRNLVNCCVVSLGQYFHVLCMYKWDLGGLLNLMKTKKKR